MFEAVRELNKKKDNKIIVENVEGKQVNSTDQKVELITEYFENIFKQKDTQPIPDIKPQKLRTPITTAEVEKAAQKLKNNKSPGSDNIQAELIKYSPQIVYTHIAHILNTAAETGEYPAELKLGNLIPLPKPGKPKGPVKNLRPIILLSVIRKILAIIVVERTFNRIRAHISITQAAYSPGRSTTELVFSFKVLAEKAICAQDYTIHLLMLDMSRAFDTIDRGKLLTDLTQILETDEVHLVSLLVTNVKLQVKYNNTTGPQFTPDIGSPQGDCASPIWFIYYLHQALSTIEPQIQKPRNHTQDIKHDHTYITPEGTDATETYTDIRFEHSYSKTHIKAKKDTNIPKSQNSCYIPQQYADDGSWATTSEETKNSIKDKVPEQLRKHNLLVNDDKTEEFSISKNGDQSWRECKFLGSLLGNNEDIQRRKQLACAAFQNKKESITSDRLSLEVRIRNFNAYVAPVFLYNCELWALTEQQANKINTFQRRFLRKIVRCKYTPNDTLYKLCKAEPWTTTVKRRRLSWFGHLQRLPDNAPAKIAFAEIRKPTRRVSGRPITTWLSTITKDFGTINTTLQTAINSAKNKKQYSLLMGRVMATVTKV